MYRKIFGLLLLLLSLGNVTGQFISIKGIFPEDTEIGLSIHFYGEKLPSRTIHQKIEHSPFEQTIKFSLSTVEFGNFWWFQLFMNQQNSHIYLKEIEFSNIAKADAYDIKSSLGIYENLCSNKIESLNGSYYFVFQEDVCQLIIGNQIFSDSRPIGIQLFLRLSLLATLLVLTLILCYKSPSHRLPLFSIALFLASIPLEIHYTNYPMGLMLLTVVIVFIRDKSRRFTWQPIFYVLCAMYLMDLIGLSYTEDFYSGFKRLDRGILLVLFPLVFSIIQFSRKNVILLLRFFVWMVIAFCAFGLLSYATIVPELTWDMIFKDSKIYAPLLMMWPAHPHPSYLSTILLMAVPVALYLKNSKIQKFNDSKIDVVEPFWVQKFKKTQFSIIETLLGVLLPIVFTILGGARVGMMIAPVLLLLGYLFYCKFRPVLKWGLVVAGITAGSILLHSIPTVDDRFTDTPRVDLRKIAISAIKEKPVFGWGTGSSKSLIHSEERAHSLGIEAPYDFNQFHNQYLEDLVQFGILGILLIFVLFGWMLWVGIREKNFLLLSLLIIYTLFCWTESVFYVSKGVVPFTFWLCFLMSNRRKIGEK